MRQVTCCLLRLNQYRLEELDGEELAIYYNGKKIWPENKYKTIKDPVTDLNLRLPVEENSSIVLDLFEYNWIFKRKIGSFKLTTESLGGPYNTDISLAKHNRYNIEWLLF